MESNAAKNGARSCGCSEKGISTVTYDRTPVILVRYDLDSIFNYFDYMLPSLVSERTAF